MCVSNRQSHQSEKKMGWSEKDTAFVENIRRKNNRAVPFSFAKLIAKHESLGY